jgi:hypothetical protein
VCLHSIRGANELPVHCLSEELGHLAWALQLSAFGATLTYKTISDNIKQVRVTQTIAV